MISRNTPSDPRLQDRRGDLVGRNALLFALVVLAAVAAAGWYVLSSRPSTDTAGASASPGGSASASASAPATPSPRPSPSPSASPQPTVTMSAVDTPADVVLDGQVMGNVTASAPRYRPRLSGQRAPEGTRFAVVQIRYMATAPLSYRAADWLVVDVGGGRHPVAAVQASEALAAGDLEAGATAEGPIAFQVPADTNVAAIVFRPEAAGRDLLAFRVP